jgi:hypothetical protein
LRVNDGRAPLHLRCCVMRIVMRIVKPDGSEPDDTEWAGIVARLGRCLDDLGIKWKTGPGKEIGIPPPGVSREHLPALEACIEGYRIIW